MIHRLISFAEYYQLKRAQAMLRALEAGGVDNWDWHHEAYMEYLRSTKGKPWALPGEHEDDNEA